MASHAKTFSALRPPLPDLLPGETTEQYDLMLDSKAYAGGDPFLSRFRALIAKEVLAMNQIEDEGERMQRVYKLCDMRGGEGNEEVYIGSPFTFEYGRNISWGRGVCAGPGCFFSDVGMIYIGSRTLLGPNIQLLTPTHPLVPEERNGLLGPEASKPIVIGDDCWLGGGVIVVAGVTIGDGCTIGAGSVVIRDVPPRSVVVGNPGRVIKTIGLDGTVHTVA